MSIDCRELRIGNWIWSDDVNIPYQLTDFGMIVVQRSFENRSPIPLTPEILEKCGFEWSIYHQAFHKQGFIFDLSERQVGGYWLHKSRLNSEIICPEIHFLHQLQNLYFALTGEELEPKL